MAIPARGIAQRLKEAMTTASVGNRAVAEAAGVHVKTVSAWRSGAHSPSDANLDAIAPLLGVTRDFLRHGREPTDAPMSPDKTSVERPLPRVAKSHGVRVWLKEFELELTRAGIPEDRISEAIDLVAAPSVFRYFAGGTKGEMDEARAIRAMGALAAIVRQRARDEGFKVPGTNDS